MSRPCCFLGRLWALVPVLAAGSAPALEGSYLFPLCLSHSLLFAPDSRLPTCRRHSSLFFTPPSTPASPCPQAFPKLSEEICPPAFLPSPLPLFPFLSPLLPTCLLVRPPPSAFPGPARAPHAKAFRKSLGQAGHSRPRASWPEPSCLQWDLQHGFLSPCPLQERRGPRGDEGQRSLLSPAFAPSSNSASKDAAPQGYSLEGRSREVASRVGRSRSVQQRS